MNYDDVDFFRSDELIDEPYEYFDHLRAKCPVQREPYHDVVMVTGYEEAVSVYADAKTFSSATSVSGPFPGFPVPLEGDDVSETIEQHRDELPFYDQLPTFDPPKHTAHRALLMRLITPKRLKENEEFMWRLADRQIEEYLARGDGEFLRGYASPFALLVVADLLGVPEADQPQLREELQGEERQTDGALGSTGEETLGHAPLQHLYDRFTTYIEDRRREPKNDVLTGLATATFPDGSTPEVIDVVRIAANLFAAGQETTARMLSTGMKVIAEDPEIQQRLRNSSDLIPNFVEETLRLEAPVKGDFRLSRVPTSIGGVEIPAGTTVMVCNGAANRDPRRFDNPSEFIVDRANARHHIAFGQGIHTCPGAPLARAEGRVSFERFLDRFSDIKINEERHGPPDARRYEYAPTFILRGLQKLYLDLTPADA